MALLHVARTDELTHDELASIRRLLDRAFDEPYDDHDWDHALGGVHVLATDGDDRLLGHASVVPRRLVVGGVGWTCGYVEAVATAPEVRGGGVGLAVMQAVGHEIQATSQLGALATGAHGFYARTGWERWQGPAWVRHPGYSRRVRDEDDAIMVLRFGPSDELDLHAPISCEDRPGDAY